MTDIGSRHTEAEIVAGLGAVLTLGGLRKELPVLVIDDNEAWLELAGRRIAEAFGDVSTKDRWTDLLTIVPRSITLMVELIDAYDRQGRLGGVKWIRGHATPAEVQAAFLEVVYASYPFARELVSSRGSVIPALTALLASSMSLPSTTGDSETPPPSEGD